MIKNFILTAIRTLLKNKTYTLLNITGLSVGIACCLLVFTLVKYEKSFDDWHTKKERIYRFVERYEGDNGTFYTGTPSYASGEALLQDIAGIERVARLHGPEGPKISFLDSKGNFKVFNENGVLYADSNFLSMMDFPLIQGGDYAQLQQPDKAMLTEKIAKKFFGNDNPIGQRLILDQNTEDERQLEVIGILKDVPTNTNLPFDILVSYETLKAQHPTMFHQWGLTWAASQYVLLPEGASADEYNEKFKIFNEKYLDEDEKQKRYFHLQPLEEIHSDERYGDGQYYVTPAVMIYAFISMAVLLLLTSCLNFINLATAQAVQRSKEIGIRKTLGSSRKQIIGQFLSETALLVLVSIGIGFIVGQFMLEGFNSMIEDIEYNLTFSSDIFWFAFILLVIITLLAGYYPSIVLSGYKPTQALKNKINLSRGSGSLNLRRVLVVVQFVLANVLIISTIIITSQMQFIRSKDLGFSFHDKVLLAFPNIDKIQSVKAAFDNKSYVESTSVTWGPPQYNSNWNMSFNIPGEKYQDGNNANLKFIDENYVEHYNLKLLAGKNLREQYQNDTTYDVLVNEKLLTNLGWTTEESLGRTLRLSNWTVKIIGVVANFHNNTLDNELGAVVLMYKPEEMRRLSIKLNNSNEGLYRSDMEATYKEFYPQEIFEPEILEEVIRGRYTLENLMYKVVSFISVLSIILSVLGLYGIVSFMANKQAKSIGIRKVFGASTVHILRMFSREYLVLMLLSFVLAAPAGYYLMSGWLNTFAYRIGLSPFHFLIGLGVSLAIALVTVGYRSYLAASANPSATLRYE